MIRVTWLWEEKDRLEQTFYEDYCKTKYDVVFIGAYHHVNLFPEEIIKVEKQVKSFKKEELDAMAKQRDTYLIVSTNEGLIIKKSDDVGYTWHTLDDEEYIDITTIVKGE